MIGKLNWKYFLLEDGDKVKANDEWYNSKEDKWEHVHYGDMDDGYYPDAIIGYEYSHDEHKPIRRRNKEISTPKLSAEEFLNSRGWDETNSLLGGALFKGFAELLEEFKKASL